MLWLAAVAAAFVMDRAFRREKIEADAVSIVTITVVLGIVGAKLWHVIDTPIEFHDMGWRVLWDTAGFAWFGGLVLGISSLLFQGWWAKIGAIRTLDLAAPSAAIGYGIGRIGSCAVESMARQPEVASSIQTAMIITAAMLEGVTLFALIVCIIKL